MTDLVAKSAVVLPPQKKKSDLGARILTAVVAIPILIYALFIGPPEFFAAIVLFAATASTWEFINITLQGRLENYAWVRPFGTLLSAFLFIIIYWYTPWIVPALCFVIAAPLALLLFLHKEQVHVTSIYGYCVAGVMYGTLPISCLALFHNTIGPSYSCWILISLGITWGSDTSAYFGGKSFGKNKLSPHVSPNKTVEGALSGMVGSILFAVGLNYIFTQLTTPTPLHTDLFGITWLNVKMTWTPLTVGQILLLAVPANVFSQIGDLAESLIKRTHNVKDSGVIIYGHGGILDRIDGVMFATPWVYFCALYIFGHFSVQ